MDSLNDLKDLLEIRLQDCKDFLRQLCIDKSYDGFARLIATPKEDLPTLINEPDPLGEYASKRLKGEPYDTPEAWIEFLGNEEMGYKEYRQLGGNDSQLLLLAEIYDKLNMEEARQEALNCVYSYDE